MSAICDCLFDTVAAISIPGGHLLYLQHQFSQLNVRSASEWLFKWSEGQLSNNEWNTLCILVPQLITGMSKDTRRVDPYSSMLRKLPVWLLVPSKQILDILGTTTASPQVVSISQSTAQEIYCENGCFIRALNRISIPIFHHPWGVQQAWSASTS